MRRYPLAIAVLVTWVCWAYPGQAQDTSEATLTQCIQGMEAVTKGNSQLQALPRFFQARARRAQIVGEDVIAIDRGTKGSDFWVIVLTIPEWRQQATFQYDSTQDLFYLTAVPMTKAWRGFGCLHETVHARDVLEGKEPRNASRKQFLAGEKRAFEAELAAVDHFTQGAFSKTLQAVLKQRQFKKSGPILMPNDSARADLDRVFPQPVAASDQERAVRDGFYVVALNFTRLPTAAERLAFLDQLY